MPCDHIINLDALFQYKTACQQVNSASLEVVIKFYLERAEQYTREAQSKADKIALETIEDLDEEADPSITLLSAVSGEDSKDRTDRSTLGCITILIL